MKSFPIWIIVLVFITKNVCGQEPKIVNGQEWMKCGNDSISPCKLVAYKQANDTLYAIAPKNCNVYSFDTIVDGIWKIYSTDSTTLLEITGVENGMRDGTSIDYYSNGKVKSELMFCRGILSPAFFTFYWDNGRTARAEVHLSGPGSFSEYYNKEGKPIDVETFLILWCK